MSNATPQGGEPILSDLDIMRLIESVLQNDEIVHVLDAHRVAIAIRDCYGAELNRLRETIGARDRLIGHLSRQLDEARTQLSGTEAAWDDVEQFMFGENDDDE